MATKKKYFYGIGRRKSATARAWLFSGKGNIRINEMPAADYLDNSQALLNDLLIPLKLTAKDKSYDISLKVRGGGSSGQVDACKLAISNALADLSDDLRGTLKKAGLLKRDSREKERKKYGLRRARKQEQYSKR